MKVLKKWKKAVVIMLTAVVLSGSFGAPVMAHGHGHHSDSHHSSVNRKGTYCAYHDKRHKKKSNCKNYCKVHKKTHSNGKKHHHHSGRR